MSLKINVIYKGIIYRVKGIKVLCSVVWTVIILLVAIVGMGVWMIINVYDDSANSLSFTDNAPNLNQLNNTKLEAEAPSIDFGKSEDVEPSKVSVFDMKIRNVEFKEVTEKTETSNPSSTPEPDYEYVYEYHDSGEYDSESKVSSTSTVLSSHKRIENGIPPERTNPDDITPFLMVRSDELHPVERIRSDNIKPSERIGLDELQPSERVRSDEIKPSERIRSDDIKPFERIRSDELNPFVRDPVNPFRRGSLEEIKPSERIVVNERNPSERIRMDEIKPSEMITEGKLSINQKTENMPELKGRTDTKLIPIKLIPKDSSPTGSVTLENEKRPDDYLTFYDLGYPAITKTNGEKIDDEKWKPAKEIKPAHTRTPTRRPVTITNQFFRRSGLPTSDRLTYVGPPVVGYGSNPYEKLTRERIREYDQFWETYTGRKSEFRFKANDTSKMYMRPHLRGLRPSGSEYDLPVRPDAQSPPKDQRTTKANNQKPLRPPTTNPDRKLLINPNPILRPSQPVLNPLQELYDYSKKLAASLLSFNSKSTEQLQDSSQKLAEYGINLLESHNHIFSQPQGGPFGRIISLLPNAERLRSMDPFELSLITWTFLDFWEFLIEKVGTLSDEDLILLQDRLENLRKRKDDAMTRVFVNETLTRYTAGKQRSIGTYKTVNGTNSQEIINNDEIKNKNGDNKSSLNQEGGSTSVPVLTNNGPILTGLFPAITDLSNDKIKEVSDTEYKNIESEEPLLGQTKSSGGSDTHQNSFPYESKAIQTDTIDEEKILESNETSTSSDSNHNLEKSQEFTATIKDTEESFSDNKYVDLSPVGIANGSNTFQTETEPSTNINNVKNPEQQGLFKRTMQRLMNFLISPRDNQRIETDPKSNFTYLAEKGRSGAWDPLGFFSSESRMKFMQFAVKVVFNFGKVYVKKPYALDCSMLLFCKDLNQAAKKGGGVESMAAKLKSVGLKVLTESEQELRESDTFGEVWRSVTAWTPLQCDAMFPRCDGPKALEIVNEVALGSN